jgi:hypothetical protein
VLLFAAPGFLQAHAAVVSKFVKNGFSEHHRQHEIPAAAKATLEAHN